MGELRANLGFWTGHISDWSFLTSHTESGDDFSEVVRVTTATAGRAARLLLGVWVAFFQECQQ